MLNCMDKTWSKKYSLSIPEYLNKLPQEAEIKGVLEVFWNIISDTWGLVIRDPFTFRNYKYTILDDQHFKREKIV